MQPKSFIALAIAFICSLLISIQLKAQPCTMAGVYTVGPSGNYPTVTAAVAALRITGLGDDVILELKTGYTSTAETFPLTFNGIPCISATKSVTIRPEAAATDLSITSTNATATVNLDNARYIRFDGRPGGTGTARGLTISNFNANGIAVRFINDASYNRLSFLSIKGSNTNSSSSGLIAFLTSTQSVTNGNSFNVISNCTIGDTLVTCFYGIYSAGSLGKKNADNVVEACHFVNATPKGLINGIYLTRYSSGWTIAGNHFYQPVNSNGFYDITTGVKIMDTTSSGFLIKDNFLGGSAPGCGGSPFKLNGSFVGITVLVNATGKSSVQNNVIANIQCYNHGTSDNFAGIQLAYGRIECGNITGNTIGTDTGYGSIKLFTKESTSPIAAGIVAGTVDNTFSYSRVDSIIIQNNKIGGIVVAPATAHSTGASICGIYMPSQITGFVDASNNVIGSATKLNSLHNLTGNAGFIKGIAGTAYTNIYGAKNKISGNLVANLNGRIRGIDLQGGAPLITNNVLRNFYNDMAGGTIECIYFTSAQPGTLISKNDIHSSVNKGSGSSLMYGMRLDGNGYTISSNFLHGLQNLTTSISQIHGISFSGTQLLIKNNMIQLGIDSAGNPMLNPLSLTALSGYMDSVVIAHNSVYMGGAGSWQSHVMNINFTGTSRRRITNNIFVNNRRLTDTTMYFNYVMNFAPHYDASRLSIDHNLYYTNVPGTYLGNWNNVKYSTIGAWRAGTGFDMNSLFGDPNFLNPTGGIASGNLHLGNVTPAESAGMAEPLVPDDFDGEDRSSLSPTDMGADAGNYASVDYDAPFLTHENFLGQPVPSAFIYRVQITDNGSGVDSSGSNKPRMWFRKRYPTTSTWYSNSGSLLSGNLQSGTWGFKPDFAMAGLLLSPGDSVEYYFVAQDKATITNVGYSNRIGTHHTSVNTQVFAPSTPLRLYIYGWLPDTVYVGAGQQYTSLTNNGGFFQALKYYQFDSLISGAKVIITSNLSETGTHEYNPIIVKHVPVTICTNSPVVKEIRSAGFIGRNMIVLQNSDRLTIDGSVNDSGRYLRFINTSDSSSNLNTYCALTLGTTSSNLKIANCIFEANTFKTSAVVSLATQEGRRIRFTNNLVRNIGDTWAALPLVGININNSFLHDSIVIRGNEIIDFAMSGVFVSQHTYIPGVESKVIIDSNHFYHTRDSLHPFVRKPIDVTMLTGQSFITSNFIGGTQRFCGGNPWISRVSVTGISLNSPIKDSYIDGNIIQNFRLRESNGTFIGISATTSGFVNIGTQSPNLVGSTASDSSIVSRANLTGIYVKLALASYYVQKVENNIISGTISDAFIGIDADCGTGQISNNQVFNHTTYKGMPATVSGFTGIKVRMEQGEVSTNKIFKLNNTALQSGNCAGLDITRYNPSSPLVVSRNRISQLVSVNNMSTFTPFLAGIVALSGYGIDLQNNQVSIENDGGSGKYSVYGIYLAGTAGYTNAKIRYNTVYLDGVAADTLPSYAMYLQHGAIETFKNNLLYNKRSSLTSKHLALGMAIPNAGPYVWSGPSSNNNLYVTADTSLVNEWRTSGPVDIRTWRDLSGGDTASFAATKTDVTADSFFVSAITGNLNINDQSPLCWYVNGKGVPTDTIAADFDSSNIRSVKISTGPTDIGADEFDTYTQAPVLIVYGRHQPGGTDTLSYNGRIMATITWGNTGTVPTLGDARWYSGRWPNDTTNNGSVSNARFMSSYFHIPASGGSNYTYSLTLYYDSSMLGKVLSESSMVINKRQSNVAGSWKTVPSTVNRSLKTITITNQTSFSEFTATDLNATLPIHLISFTAVAKDNDVLVKWNVFPGDEEKFEVERSFDGVSYFSISIVFPQLINNGSYNYYDEKVLKTHIAKAIYYRLKLFSKSGEISYSHVAIIRSEAPNPIVQKVAPNPFSSDLRVLVTLQKAKQVKFMITDEGGRLVLVDTRSLDAGEHSIIFKELDKLSPGTYTFSTIFDGNIVSQRVIKIRR